MPQPTHSVNETSKYKGYHIKMPELLTALVAPILTQKAIESCLNKVSKIKNGIWNDTKFSFHNVQLVQSLQHIGIIKTLYHGANRNVELNEFFIEPKLKLNNAHSDKPIKINSLQEIQTERNILITGTVGQGKSVFMRYLALQELTYGKLPIFIECKYISSQKSIQFLLNEYFQNWLTEPKPNTISDLLNSGKITLFIDAFDEIGKDWITDTVSTIESYSRDFPKLKIIVSSRPHHTISHSTHFSTVELLPYDVDEQKSLIHKLVSDTEARNNLQDAIEAATVEIQAVLTTPLMVVLFIQKYLHDFSAPQNLTDFYANIFDIVVDKHNKTKTGFIAQSQSGLNNPTLESIFTRFCFDTAIKNQTAMARTELMNFIQKAWDSNSIQYADKSAVDINKIADDFQKYMCLVLQDGEQYTFTHKSIQEFYTAKFIANLSEKNACKVIDGLQRQISDHRTICRFIKQLNPYYYDKYYLLPNLNRLNAEYKLGENNHINRLAFIDLLEVVLEVFIDHQKNNNNEAIWSLNLTHKQNSILDKQTYLFLDEHNLILESTLFYIELEINEALEELFQQLTTPFSQLDDIEIEFVSPNFQYSQYFSDEFEDISPELSQQFNLWKRDYANSQLINDYFELYLLTLAQCRARIKAKEQELEDSMDLNFD